MSESVHPRNSADHITDLSELDSIRHYFTRPTPRVILDVGDDCALPGPHPGCELTVSTDVLITGYHFFPHAGPRAFGHKTLAVNLSDPAAVGVEPRAFTLAVALLETDPTWLRPFSEGLLVLADAFHYELIGSDTTRGSFILSLTIFGDAPPAATLRRDIIRPGDDLWVSGTVDGMRLALGALRNEWILTSEVLA